MLMKQNALSSSTQWSRNFRVGERAYCLIGRRLCCQNYKNESGVLPVTNLFEDLLIACFPWACVDF